MKTMIRSRRIIYKLLVTAGVLFAGFSMPLQALVTGSEIPQAQPPRHKSSITPIHKEVWLTVFIHGIISIKPHLSIENVIRFFQDDVENTLYERTVELMRKDPFFYQNQPMQGLGLQPIAKEPLKRGAAATLLVHVLDTVDKLNHEQSSIAENHYYTFGWSGLMSHKARYKAAKDLYLSLLDEVKKYKSRGITPKIRLIGYSHGGNVLLNLANVRNDEPVDTSLVINETILLGTPVQMITASLVNDHVFEKIYNIYSPGDRIQKLDIFCGQFMSHRLFKKHNCSYVPNKLVQIEIRTLRRAGEKNSSGLFDRDLKYRGPHKSYLLRDVSAGHTELWFFGWTPMHYRRTFPLYPLPIVAVLPYLLNTIRPLEDEFDPESPIIMSLDPHSSTIIVRGEHDPGCHIVPFISQSKLAQLKQEMLHYAPSGFTSNRYEYRIQVAYDEAHLFHQQRKTDVRISKKRRGKKKATCQIRHEEMIRNVE